MTPAELQKDFDRFYEDFYMELCKYGHILEMHVSDQSPYSPFILQLERSQY